MVSKFNSKINILYFYYFFLICFSFSINYWTASRGVLPLDTFLHFDSGSRILNNELPIRDYWIVHGLLVDYMQSLFFKMFGVNWKSYVIHSSLFNFILTIFSFKIFKDFKIGDFKAFLLSVSFSILAYPVSGTPFLDLHSAYLSLIAVYFLILAIKNNNSIYIYFSTIALGLAFLCKQVPAGYTILGIGIYIVFYSYRTKSLIPITYSLYGVITFFTLLFIFLFSTGTDFQNFFFQLITFPGNIAEERFSSYSLNLNNVFFNFKFIYFFLIFIFFFVGKDIIRNKKICEQKLNYFFIITIYTISLIHHQIFTKNQIFIFFLIPILCAFAIHLIDNDKFEKKFFFTVFLILVCIFSTLKYGERYVIDRKFHELEYVKKENSVKMSFVNKKLKGLNWISPYFSKPQDELKNIINLYQILQNDKSNKMLITEYNFFSSLLEENLNSPSRTFDDISYPKKNSKYFTIYKNFFKEKIKSKKIQNIYIFETKEIKQERLNHLVFNYISKNCFEIKHINSFTKKLIINKCYDLKS